MPDFKALSVELVGKIARVVIHRPEKINAMNAEFWTRIIAVFRWVNATDEVTA